MHWPTEEPTGPEDRPPPRPLKGCAWLALFGVALIIVTACLALQTIGDALEDDPTPRPSWLNPP